MDKYIIDFEVIKKELRHGTYIYIGSGSSRSVFDLNNGYVVKAAINRGGIYQNKVEYNVYNQEHTALFAPILTMSEDAMFLIMKKGEKLLSLSQVIQYYDVRDMRQLVERPYFVDIRRKYGLARGDLVRRSSWGIVDEVPVLIDYGYTGRKRL
ncbi:hypothetical protein [Anaerosporobacter sp.]